MRSLIRSLLAFFAVGVSAAIGCHKAAEPPPPADVVLNVPGMH
jgi:hypothetical protein